MDNRIVEYMEVDDDMPYLGLNFVGDNARYMSFGPIHGRKYQFGVKGKDVEQILDRYGLTLEFLEEAYVAFQSGEVTSVRASAKKTK